MGVPMTKPRGLCVTGRNGVRKYVPLIRYTPFPEERRKSPGELICQFRAYPGVAESETSDELYWWTDCKFMPYNDSTLFTSSGAYNPRFNHTWLPDKQVPVGRLCRFDFDRPKIRCEMFSGTATSAYPKVQFHPDSFHVGYLGAGEVKLVTLENTGFHSKARDLSFRTYKSFDISPDGDWYAIMARNHSAANYDLVLFSSRVVTTVEASIDLKKLNSEFKGLRSYTEHTECKWSPDSNYIGVSISTGQLMVLKRKDRSLVADIFQDIIPNSAISVASAFDFDPKFGHHILVVGALDRTLYVIDVDSGEKINQSEVCSSSPIDAVKYTSDGSLIGVATQDFKICLYDSETCCISFSIDMKDSCPGLQKPVSGPLPAIIRMNFTMSGEQVIAAMHDGCVRMWQLPKRIELQNIVKFKILSLVPVGMIKQLPLPPSVIDDLLDIPAVLENKSDVMDNVDMQGKEQDKMNEGSQEPEKQTYKYWIPRERTTMITFKNVQTDFNRLNLINY